MQNSTADDPRQMLASKLHALFAVCGASINREVMRVYGEKLIPFVGDELWAMLDEAIAEGGKLPSAHELSDRIIAQRRRRASRENTEQLFAKLDVAMQQSATPEAMKAGREAIDQVKRLLGMQSEAQR